MKKEEIRWLSLEEDTLGRGRERERERETERERVRITDYTRKHERAKNCWHTVTKELSV